MPETTTASGFQTRILEAHPEMNRNYAKRVAYRLKRRMDMYSKWADAEPEAIYEEGLRILGSLTDETPRRAILGY